MESNECEHHLRAARAPSCLLSYLHGNKMCKRLKHCPVFDSSAASKGSLESLPPLCPKATQFLLENHASWSLAPCNYPHVHWTWCLHSCCVRTRTRTSILHFSLEYAHNLGVQWIRASSCSAWGLQFPHVHEFAGDSGDPSTVQFFDYRGYLQLSAREIMEHNLSKSE